MNATFVEVSQFTEWIYEHLTERNYASFQQLLMIAPDAGDVMPGCGGLRKVRTVEAKRNKGKRGGARIIYLHVPRASRFYLLDVYGKDEKDDLTPKEKKHLRQLAERLKVEAIADYERWLLENES